MKVSELIDELERLDPNYEVKVVAINNRGQFVNENMENIIPNRFHKEVVLKTFLK